MLKKSILVFALIWGMAAQTAQATPCGGQHPVAAGDSLSFLASLGPHYSDASYWPVLFQANKDRIGPDPNLIFPGVLLRIPCLDENGNLLPGQFDDDGNPIESAFNGTHDHASMMAAAQSGTSLDNAQANNDHNHSDHNHGDSAATTEADTTATTDTDETTSTTAAVSTQASSAATTVATAAPVSNASAAGDSIRLLTGDDYGISVDRSISNGRVVAKLVDAALTENKDVSHNITWINDWSAHLDPLLTTHSFDVGFPWLKPNCETNASDARCGQFLFSDPIYEISMMLFVNAESPMSFNSDADMVGKKICRPSGYFTHDLDNNDRNWLAEGKIELKQPGSVQQCFRMLLQNQIDAVAVNEYTGRTIVKSMKLDDQVSVLDSTPLSKESVYAIIHNQHPRAEELMGKVNQSIQTSRSSGAYQEILSSN